MPIQTVTMDGRKLVKAIPWIGVLGHLDVVPQLIDDWKSDPFTVNYRDGKAYGRGVQMIKAQP